MEALLLILTIAVVIYAGLTQAKLEGLKEDIRNLKAASETYRNEVLELEERSQKLYIANLMKDKAMERVTDLKACEFERDKVEFGNWLLNNKDFDSLNGKSVTDADLQNYYCQQQINYMSKPIFNVGDTVYCKVFGEGVVKAINNQNKTKLT